MNLIDSADTPWWFDNEQPTPEPTEAVFEKSPQLEHGILKVQDSYVLNTEDPAKMKKLSIDELNEIKKEHAIARSNSDDEPRELYINPGLVRLQFVNVWNEYVDNLPIEGKRFYSDWFIFAYVSRST